MVPPLPRQSSLDHETNTDKKDSCEQSSISHGTSKAYVGDHSIDEERKNDAPCSKVINLLQYTLQIIEVITKTATRTEEPHRKTSPLDKPLTGNDEARCKCATSSYAEAQSLR